jgi:hypothetical protein
MRLNGTFNTSLRPVSGNPVYQDLGAVCYDTDVVSAYFYVRLNNEYSNEDDEE